MVFSDWTVTGTGTGLLDSGIKYAGNSSYRARLNDYQDVVLTHNWFSQPQAQLIFWTRFDFTSNASNRAQHVKLSDYTWVNCHNYTRQTWDKFKVTFWYDIPTNTKWGRSEIWDGSNWVQKGSDINCGAGAPIPSSILLRAAVSSTVDYRVWWDELEVYS